MVNGGRGRGRCGTADVEITRREKIRNEILKHGRSLGVSPVEKE
jgi:hypothetical protein